MKLIILSWLLLICETSFGQTSYTTDQYSYTLTSDLQYGIATGFDGIADTLLLDIYTPIGDANCQRPCLILVHGGAWMAGSKTEGSIPAMAAFFAQRGWVVAAINYRLGMHKQANYTQYWACTPDLAAPCSYMADSSEVIRAIFRGQQDVKGAIRFMKNRSETDSTDTDHFFVAGESAGGFNALAAAFLDDPAEKYPQAFAIANAPTPDPDLVNCLEQGYSLVRPDLGSIDGSLNTGPYDARVEGVGSIYGGALNVDLFANVTDWPALYFFHQGSDVIVHYNYGRLLGRLDAECLSIANICQPYSVAPHAYGGKGVRNYLNGLPAPPQLTADIIENYEWNNDCFDNGHAIDNMNLRLQNMVQTFATRISENGNTGPGCILSSSELVNDPLRIFPNPSTGLITLYNASNTGISCSVWLPNGQVIDYLDVFTTRTLELQPGVYFLRYEQNNVPHTERVIITR